jgi:small nuclear ribonucleoprotein (snRNP)-like protein
VKLKGTHLNNKVVARFADGRVVKGSTSDFVPTKDVFHVAAVDAAPGSKPLKIQTKELKAVFFVKDLVGKPEYQMHQVFDPGRPLTGRKVKVVFKDGEVLLGTTQGYEPNRPGLFMLPADQDSNIERCYVVAAATRKITLL